MSNKSDIQNDANSQAARTTKKQHYDDLSSQFTANDLEIIQNLIEQVDKNPSLSSVDIKNILLDSELSAVIKQGINANFVQLLMKDYNFKWSKIRLVWVRISDKGVNTDALNISENAETNPELAPQESTSAPEQIESSELINNVQHPANEVDVMDNNHRTILKNISSLQSDIKKLHNHVENKLEKLEVIVDNHEDTISFGIEQLTRIMANVKKRTSVGVNMEILNELKPYIYKKFQLNSSDDSEAKWITKIVNLSLFITLTKLKKEVEL